MTQIPLTLTADEHRDFEELLSDVHELIDPDMDLTRLLSTVHNKAVVAFRDGSIEQGELRDLIRDMITADVVEENRRQLPDDPAPDDVMHLVGEIERRLASVALDGKQLVYRAMLLRALRDWREFGTLVFAERWLV